MLNSGSCEIPGRALDGLVGQRLADAAQALRLEAGQAKGAQQLDEVAQGFAELLYATLFKQMQQTVREQGEDVDEDEQGPVRDGVLDLVAMHMPKVLAGCPQDALAGGDDGLECIRAIIDRAHNYIVRQGWMLLEHGADQQKSVQRLLEAQRYYDIHCFQDLAGNDRITECRFVE